MTSDIIRHLAPEVFPDPFPSHQAVRLAKALRLVLDTMHRPRFEDIVLRLRLEPSLPDGDFQDFLAALLAPRTGFKVEAWVMAIAAGER